MVYFTALTVLSLLSTTLASTGSISGTGPLPPYPTISAPYPLSNSTVPVGPTGTVPPPPPLPPGPTTCPPPLTVTVTSSSTVTTTITVTSSSPLPTGTSGTGVPSGTAAPTGYYRGGLEMRGLTYVREEKKEKRDGFWGWF